MIGLVALLAGAIGAQAAPRLGCPEGKLCVDARRIRALADYRLRCMRGDRPAFDLAIAGQSKPHERPAMVTPLALHLPAGRADNRYAPLALNVGGAARINESFAAVDGQTTYYLLLSFRLDRLLTDPSGEQDVRIVNVNYEINRGKAGAMAKPYAEGSCIIMDGQA